MIRSFRHRGLKRLYERGDRSRINAQQVDKVESILANLDAASEPSDMDLPGYKFHALRGDLKDCYSVWVTANWRIVFRFVDEPEDVDFTDYH
jgi:proteic killer suppression protein